MSDRLVFDLSSEHRRVRTRESPNAGDTGDSRGESGSGSVGMVGDLLAAIATAAEPFCGCALDQEIICLWGLW